MPSRVFPVALFTLAYVAGFTVWFLSSGNWEFILYIVTMAGLMVLIGLSVNRAAYPTAMLWALSLWGLLHMAGGGVPVAGSVLYSSVLLPIAEVGDSVILKYDQIVHAFGFGVTAWLLHHLLTHNYPNTRGTWTAFAFPLLASMGLGALNEMIEFSATLAVPDTNVGGYLNTALDLCFNALGALIACLVVARR